VPRGNPRLGHVAPFHSPTTIALVKIPFTHVCQHLLSQHSNSPAMSLYGCMACTISCHISTVRTIQSTKILHVWQNEQNVISCSYDVCLSPFKLHWVRNNEAYTHVRFEAILNTFIFEHKLIPWIRYQLVVDELQLYNNKLCVPDSAELKHLIMDEFNRRPYVGHHGYHKMITLVRQLYYWPRMKQVIMEYIAKCLECQ
jgi:hypothetical protein